jgi:hypothetical protein
MKKIMIFSFFILLQSGLCGQDPDPRRHSKDPAVRAQFKEEQYEDIKNNAEYIFEGIVLKTEIYPRVDKFGKEYYANSQLIKITKILRGNLKLGTVEFICVQPIFSGFSLPPERTEVHLWADSLYFYFCKSGEKDFPYDPRYNIYSVDNKRILTSSNKYIEFRFDPHDNELFGKQLRSRGEFYRILRTLPNIKMPALTAEDTIEYHGIITPGEPQFKPNSRTDSMNKLRKKEFTEEQKKK